MKYAVLVFVMIVFGLNSKAQGEVFSFYFNQKTFTQLKDVAEVDKKYFGKYELSEGPQNEIRKSAGEYLLVDQSGIYIEKNRISHISREEVRENSKYRVKKGWLFGVLENDSIPCALDGEEYYFLVPAKTYLYESGVPPTNLIQFSNQQYGIFNFEDNGYYSLIVIDFNSGSLKIKDVVFTIEGSSGLSNIKQLKKVSGESDDFDTFILNPTKEEWDKFIIPKCLKVYDSYKKLAQED